MNVNSGSDIAVNLDIVRDAAVGFRIVGTIAVAVIAVLCVVWYFGWFGYKDALGLLRNPVVRKIKREWPRREEFRMPRWGVPMLAGSLPKVRSHRPHGRHQLLAIEPSRVEAPVVVDPVAVVAAEPEPADQPTLRRPLSPKVAELITRQLREPAVGRGRHYALGETTGLFPIIVPQDAEVRP